VLTFFTTGKPFIGHSGIIQRNALKSWRLLHPDAEIILFGDDSGAAEVARELGVRHEAHVERNEHGTKRLDFMFAKAQAIARHDLLCYINCDIILMDDFGRAIELVRAKHPEFLMVGRRWDLDLSEACNFSDPNWQRQLRDLALRNGRQRTPDWIDYFVFPRGLYGKDMPPFVIGRVFWDNWLLWKVRQCEKPVVDASRMVIAVHQNHDYGYHPQGHSGVWFGSESGENYKLAGGWNHLRTIADATEVLTGDGLHSNATRHWSSVKRYVRQAGRVMLYDCWHPVWFFILSATRPLRVALGLRAANLRRYREKT
jgi:hypothetical protein